jgi:hypothetical protein
MGFILPSPPNAPTALNQDFSAPDHLRIVWPEAAPGTDSVAGYMINFGPFSGGPYTGQINDAVSPGAGSYGYDFPVGYFPAQGENYYFVVQSYDDGQAQAIAQLNSASWNFNEQGNGSIAIDQVVYNSATGFISVTWSESQVSSFFGQFMIPSGWINVDTGTSGSFSDWGLSEFPINGTFSIDQFLDGPGTYIFNVQIQDNNDPSDNSIPPGSYSGTLSVQDIARGLPAPSTLFSGYSPELAVNFAAPVAIKPTPIPTLVSISVSPATQSLIEGQGCYFQAFGTWSDGLVSQLYTIDQVNAGLQPARLPTAQFPNDPYLHWTTQNQNGIGAIDSLGHFVAKVAGSDVIVLAGVAGNTISGRADVAIAQQVIPPSKLLSLSIVPQNPVVQVNQTVQFSAVGQSLVFTDVQGQVVSSVKTTFPPVAWTIIPGIGNGTITSNGSFTATDIRKQLSTSWWQGNSSSYLPPSHNGPIATAPTTTTIDGPIDYGFTQSLPAGIGSTYFYARFVGYIIPPLTGAYVFGLNSQDGANLFVNGQSLILDLQNNHTANVAGTPTTTSSAIILTANGRYPIVLEWGHGTGATSNLELLWQPPGQTMQPVPGNLLEGDQPGGAPCTIVATSQDGQSIQATTIADIVASQPPPAPPSYIAELVITPLLAIVAAGSTQQFTAEALDQFGNVVPNIPVVWSVANFSGAGTIDSNGVFFGEIAGSKVVVTVSTTDGAFSASAQVIVVAGPVVRIVVTPPSALLQTGFGQQFTATGYDAFGNSRSLSNVIWSLTGGIGTINQSGLLSATNAGTGRVIATYAGLQGYASVNVLIVVGGVIIKTTPQQPFAKITIRDVVAQPTVIDTRVRGGGLSDPSILDTSNSFWWDLQPWDGAPFQLYGVYAAEVTLPARAGQTLNPDLTQTLIQQVFGKYAAPQFYGVVSPQSSIPQNS